jgi:hypothetical protein
MNRASVHLLAARLIGGLAVLEAAYGLSNTIFVELGWGFRFLGLLGFVDLAYFLILMLLAIGTLLAQYRARLGLSALLAFQTCWLIVTVPLNATDGHREGCDFSCYAGPLEGIAISALLCIIAAWVVFPGWKKPAK